MAGVSGADQSAGAPWASRGLGLGLKVMGAKALCLSHLLPISSKDTIHVHFRMSVRATPST